MAMKGCWKAIGVDSPPASPLAHRHRLADLLESRPVAYGYLSGVWTSPMVARVIAEEFGCQYHPGHVRKLLHHPGFSVQRPTRTLARPIPPNKTSGTGTPNPL